MRSFALALALVSLAACADTAQMRRAAIAAQHEAEKSADIAALNDVTRLLMDVRAVHEAAAKACEGQTAALFSDLAVRRARMAEEWQARVAFVGGDTSALSERAHAALVANSSPTPAAAVEAEEALLGALSEAVQRPGLSADTLAFLRAQLADVQAQASQLQAAIPAGLRHATLAAAP